MCIRDSHEAVQLVYHFFWDDFCDWYIELVKDEITSEEVNTRRDVARSRIITILEQALRLLHPFMPFLTEELWQKLPEVSKDLHNAAYKNAAQTIMLADFPRGDPSMIDELAESEMQAVIELISKVRNIRAEYNIKPSEKVVLLVSAHIDAQEVFGKNEPQILKLARASELKLAMNHDVPKASAKAVLSGIRGQDNAEVDIPLKGLIDFDKERSRNENEIEKLNIEKKRLDTQLSNQNFLERAPAEKVEELYNREDEIRLELMIREARRENLKDEQN